MNIQLLRKAMVLAAVIQLSVLAGIRTVSAQEPPLTPPPPISAEMLDRHTFRVSPPEKIAPGQYRIGGININKTDKTLSFPAFINMEKGLLEYLLVRNAGKTHESLLRTAVEPYNLQVASLLLGLEGTAVPLTFQGSPEIPKGDPVEITIQFDGKDSKKVTVKPEEWIIQVVDGVKKDIPPVRWVFSGSVVHNGRFAAQVDGSIISVFHDPVAMIDNTSPGGESDKIWFVKEGVVPAVGTPVTVIIKSLK